MSDNYEKDMALTLQEALSIINSVEENKIEISKGHEKTIAFMGSIFASTTEMVNFIKTIEECDYISGPIPDDKPSERRNKPVWIFKKHLFGISVYIKIKIFITNRKVYVLSLHEDERS